MPGDRFAASRALVSLAEEALTANHCPGESVDAQLVMPMRGMVQPRLFSNAKSGFNGLKEAYPPLAQDARFCFTRGDPLFPERLGARLKKQDGQTKTRRVECAIILARFGLLAFERKQENHGA